MNHYKRLLVLAVMLPSLSVCKSKYHWQTQQVTEGKNYLVFPGTKWCGKGNNAMFYEDLGKHRETDSCCRAHDHCPTFIPPFKRRYGLLNFNTMQMSHCSCERQLFDCLWKLESPVSTAVGRLYFNVFRSPCIKLIEVKTCTKWSFDWWNLKYFCKKYGTTLKAKKFWLKNYLRQFPESIRQKPSAPYTELSTGTTTTQKHLENDNAISQNSTISKLGKSTEATTVLREGKDGISRRTYTPRTQHETEATTVLKEDNNRIHRKSTSPTTRHQSAKAVTLPRRGKNQRNPLLTSPTPQQPTDATAVIREDKKSIGQSTSTPTTLIESTATKVLSEDKDVQRRSSGIPSFLQPSKATPIEDDTSPHRK